VADIRATDFRGFGTARVPEEQGGVDYRWLCESVSGLYDAEVQWNGTPEMEVSSAGIVWKGVLVVPEEIVAVLTPQETVRLRFTVFCPAQGTAWAPEGIVGVTESFDVTFDRDAKHFSGVFIRQYEGTLAVSGTRRVTAEERRAKLPGLVRSRSRDPERECPVCYSGFDEDGVTQVVTPCGHSFCLACVVSTCNITPPNESGTCPLCRGRVTLDGLKRVVRP